MSKEDKNRPIIEPQKDGPLKVTGLQEFRNSRGEKIAAKQTVFLCRCGASKKKPFCDGSHAAVGFTDDRSDDRVPDRLDRYEGRELTVRDNRGQCAHAGHCTSGLPQVWRMGVEPWVDPDGASADDIKQTIRKCPSGALAWEEGGKTVTDSILVSSRRP